MTDTPIRRTILVELFCFDELNMPLSEFMEKASESLATVPAEYRDSVVLCHNASGNLMWAEYARPETDEDVAERWRAEQIEQEQAVAIARKQYERLKEFLGEK